MDPQPVTPTITITTPPNSAQYTTGQVVKANYKCTASRGTVTCTGTVQNGANISTTAGSHTFTVTAKDTVGRRSKTATKTVSYTATTSTPPPGIPPAPSLSGQPPAITNAGSATFTFSDTQAGVTFQCASDGGAYTPCTSPKPYSFLADGAHTFAVEAVDTAGASASTSASWTVDATAPVVSITTPTANQNVEVNSSVYAAYTCTDLHLASCVGTVANGAALATNSLGSHTFTVTAKDAAGNETVQTVNYTVVDTQLPTVTITSPASDGSSSFSWNQSVKAAFTCTSPVGIASCVGTVANGANVPTSGAEGPGTFTFKVTATDTYGLTETQTVNYTVQPKGYVALTFDDGPSSLSASYVADLNAGGWHATFFNIGDQMSGSGTDVCSTCNAMEVANGEEIGNHTYDHTSFTGQSVPDGTVKIAVTLGSTSITLNAGLKIAGDNPTPLAAGQPIVVVSAGVQQEFTTSAQVSADATTIPIVADTTSTVFPAGSNVDVPLTETQIQSELTQQSTIVNSQVPGGYTEDLFRPPYGDMTGPYSVGFPVDTFDYVQTLGYTTTMWTLDSGDSDTENNDGVTPLYTSAQLVSNVVNGYTDGNGTVWAPATDQSVVLMHDDHPNTLAAVPGIIAGLKAEGYASGKVVPSTTSLGDDPVNGLPMNVKVVAW